MASARSTPAERAPRSPWPTWTSPSTRATCTVSSDPTARARPPRSGCCSALPPPPEARWRCSANRCRRSSRPWSAGSVRPRVAQVLPQLHRPAEPQLLARSVGVPDQRVDAAIETVGLRGRETGRYKTYSLGMKQRLAIAATLLKDPRLLILDEPTNGLDPAGIREVREVIRDLGELGVTVLISSHILAEVQQVCTTADHHRQRADLGQRLGHRAGRVHQPPTASSPPTSPRRGRPSRRPGCGDREGVAASSSRPTSPLRSPACSARLASG